MSYKHILVTVDPSGESQLLIEKAVMLAKASEAELSFISLDEAYNESYLHMPLDHTSDRTRPDHPETIEHQDFLEGLIEDTDYPVKSILVGCGDIADNIEKAIKEEGIDLVVCSHHHDFWHSIFSSAAKLMKNADVDLFVISIK